MFQNIEKKIFIPCFLILVAILVPLLVAPEQTNDVFTSLFLGVTDNLGWLFMLVILITFGFAVWIAASKYGNIRFGGQDAKPQYKTIPWAGMLFTAGVGTSIVIYGFLEPIYYLTTTPFDVEPMSEQAYLYANVGTHFHWGPSAWVLYTPAIVGIAYVMFNRKKSMMRLSTVCDALFKNKKGTSLLRHVIDVLVVIGIIGGVVTSLGIGTPVVSKLLREVFGISEQYETVVNVVVLLIWTSIFGTSVFFGLEKGIQRLSNANLVLAFAFMAFLLVVGPTLFILKLEVSSLGIYLQEFFHLSTQTDPFGDGLYARDWTSFYWAWWLTFVPLMGMFIAKISRGRTIRNVVIGNTLWGSAGCCLTFMVFGGYSLWLQNSGQVDLSGILAESGNADAMAAIMETLPLPKIMMLLLCVLLFVYLATTIDSSAYVLAASTSKEITEFKDPARWNRMFWAIIFCVFAFGVVSIGGMAAVKNITVISGVPLVIVQFLLMAGVKKMLEEDYPELSRVPEIEEPKLEEAEAEAGGIEGERAPAASG